MALVGFAAHGLAQAEAIDAGAQRLARCGLEARDFGLDDAPHASRQIESLALVLDC